MRVLWLSGNQSLFSKADSKYYSGGWIGALEQSVHDYSNIELAVAFFSDSNEFKITGNNVTYYPINLYNTYWAKFKRNLNFEKADALEIDHLIQIKKDFKPDIIHVWGTEISFGLVKEVVDIPIVIHFQGMLSAVYNSFFTPGLSRSKYVGRWYCNWISWFNKTRFLNYMEHTVKREKRILKINNNYMGRTCWDKKIINLFSPNSTYYHCDEILRPEFYGNEFWQYKNRSKRIIVSVLSDATYKGLDVILKCAKVLSNYSNLCFEWQVYGVSTSGIAEWITKINPREVSVDIKGIIRGDLLAEALLEADLFVNPSYIENSPNSVCEAQILGVPVISTNVGGIPSLVKDKYSGQLVIANDPLIMAYEILGLIDNAEKANLYSINERLAAKIRHNPKRVVSELVSIYKNILN